MAISPGLQRRTNRRLARIRLRNPNKLAGIRKGGISLSESRKIKKVDKRQRLRDAKKKQATARAKAYDPLAPITGAREKSELAAAEKLEFGPAERELRRANASLAQQGANEDSYYEDYKKSLIAASTRQQAANDANVTTTEGRVDSAFKEDSAAVAARDKADAERDKALGRVPEQSNEGMRAVQAQRSQGNQAAAEVRNRASSDMKFAEGQVTNASLGKAQAATKRGQQANVLRREAADLASKRGSFRTDFRRKTRESERQWAAIQKEFGLKEKDLNIKAKTSSADRAIERQKVRAQKIVARLYSSADRKSAKSQIRVAELQLQKGKINKHQFRTIKNIYEGLPGGGSAKTNGKPPKGSGPGGTYAPWERDKITNGAAILKKNGATAADKNKWIARMENEGMPRRLALAAWRRYLKQNNAGRTYTPGS